MMSNLTYTIVGLLMLCLCYSAQAQDRVVLGEVEGIEIAYEIQFLGTDEKKNASKNKDEYQIIGYLTNNTGKDLYTRDITPVRVEVTNGIGLTKAAKPNPMRTEYMTIDNQTLYVFRAGTTIQNQAKVKVPQGIKPVINYEKDGLFKEMSEWKLKMNEAIVNGNWQLEGSNTVVSMRYDATQNVIVQSDALGFITWYPAPNDVYERVFIGVGVLGGATPIDVTAVYRSTLTLVEPGRLVYTNSEGVTAYFIKQ